MHNHQSVGHPDAQSLVPITQWVRPIVMRHLPHSTSDANKIVKELIRVHNSNDLEMIDFYAAYHLPYKWTPFEEHIAYQISHMARHFMPSFRTNFSPLQAGIRPRVDRATSNNPSMTGQSSTSSVNSSSSSSGGEDSPSDDDTLTDRKASVRPTMVDKPARLVRFGELFPAMRDVYGGAIVLPDAKDMLRYSRYVQIGKLAMPSTVGGAIASRSSSKSASLGATSDYGNDCFEQIAAPLVADASRAAYERYLNAPHAIQRDALGEHDAALIRNYVQMC